MENAVESALKRGFCTALLFAWFCGSWLSACNEECDAPPDGDGKPVGEWPSTDGDESPPDGDEDISSDGDAAEADTDADREDWEAPEWDGSCPPPSQDWPWCSGMTESACLDRHQPENCGDSRCFERGFAYVCKEGRCVEAALAEDGDMDDEATESDAAAKLSGVWGLTLTAAYRVGGLTHQDTQNVSFYLARFYRVDDGTRMQAKLCAIRDITYDGAGLVPSEDELAWTVYPEAFINNAPLLEFAVTEPLPDAGDSFLTERTTGVMGVDVALSGEDLPTKEEWEAGDARVRDDDRDCKPGVTSLVKGVLEGEIYSVLRLSARLTGKREDADRLGGLSCTEYERETIGADPASIVFAGAPRPVDSDTYSYFRMLRLPDTADCETLRVEAIGTSGDWEDVSTWRTDGWLSYVESVEAGDLVCSEE